MQASKVCYVKFLSFYGNDETFTKFLNGSIENVPESTLTELPCPISRKEIFTDSEHLPKDLFADRKNDSSEFLSAGNASISA